MVQQTKIYKFLWLLLGRRRNSLPLIKLRIDCRGCSCQTQAFKGMWLVPHTVEPPWNQPCYGTTTQHTGTMERWNARTKHATLERSMERIAEASSEYYNQCHKHIPTMTSYCSINKHYLVVYLLLSPKHSCQRRETHPPLLSCFFL
jgi:hypothetical protein